MKVNDEKYSYRDVTRLTNEALLDLYTLFVKIDQFDPTPEYAAWNKYNNVDQLYIELIARMQVLR